MWLDPIPLEQDIPKAYTKYYTHTVNSNDTSTAQPRIYDILSFLNPMRRERERLSLMYLGDSKPGRLLDVGCGNGLRLAKMRQLGWDVVGQDVDLQAVTYGRENLGLEVHLGRLEDIGFREESFDAITLNHVIEHAHDPVKLLMECRRILRRGGHLMIVTPNSESFAHKHFGASWRGLEPPRHIHIFSPTTLTAVVTRAGLNVCRSRTTVANATTFWRSSMTIRNGCCGADWNDRFVTRVRALVYLYRSILEYGMDKDSGEECILKATR